MKFMQTKRLGHSLRFRSSRVREKLPGLACDCFKGFCFNKCNTCRLTVHRVLHHRNLRGQIAHLPQLEKSSVLLGHILKGDQLRTQLQDLLARIAFIENQPLPQNRDDFEIRNLSAVEQISIAHKMSPSGCHVLLRPRMMSANALKRSLQAGRRSLMTSANNFAIC